MTKCSRLQRTNPIDTVDKAEYDSFQLHATGEDEYGPYWVARVEKDGKKFLTGNFYCIEEEV